MQLIKYWWELTGPYTLYLAKMSSFSKTNEISRWQADSMNRWRSSLMTSYKHFCNNLKIFFENKCDCLHEKDYNLYSLELLLTKIKGTEYIADNQNVG